ncbi:DNA alkylation repair protein [Desulfonatronovibrio hydrogenovorans]|uniref:DNA alkylation repair protein n=1 Tax=Desulfonatronovibrio hydrogenovorans TaxID=53245 RepID=UPI000A5ED23D|nr:DNA alkylation repair protein [Desulfonatronovibrio hydrogenovorans]
MEEIRSALLDHADQDRASTMQRFFKTGPGEYGQGDRFLGVSVPLVRLVAKKYRNIELDQALILLKSVFHEERLLALIILGHKYQKGARHEQEEIFRAYLDHTRYINNWDLVDVSAEHIVGAYLFSRSRSLLYQLAESTDIWERRIAVMSTFYFIKKGEFDETLRIAEQLISDSHDLIHKAVGWMLREIGKRDREVEDVFLQNHYQSMPRTMLRYAIEKFPEDLRQKYLKGQV